MRKFRKELRIWWSTRPHVFLFCFWSDLSVLVQLRIIFVFGADVRTDTMCESNDHLLARAWGIKMMSQARAGSGAHNNAFKLHHFCEHSEKLISFSQILIHLAVPQSRPVAINIFAHVSVRPSLFKTSQNKTNKNSDHYWRKYGSGRGNHGWHMSYSVLPLLRNLSNCYKTWIIWSAKTLLD